MSEKHPAYVQVLSPKLEDVIDVLTKARGTDRSWSDYAKDSSINPSTMSRIINGKQKSPLTIKTIEKLFDHRAETCKLTFDQFLLANGYIDSEKQRDYVDQTRAFRDEIDRAYDVIERSIVNSLYDRGISFDRVDHVGDGTPNEEEILNLFGNVPFSQLLRINRNGGDDRFTWGFEYVPIRSDEEDTEKHIREYVQLAVENYATIFLMDAWHLDERLSDHVTFAFIDERLYNTFIDSFKKRRLNHYMTALLIDADETEVIDEKPLGDQAGKVFSGLFDAPQVRRTGRRFGEQIKMFPNE